jgi:acyl-CoA dehydrogenase
MSKTAELLSLDRDTPPSHRDLLAIAAQIGKEVAEPAASEVDQHARFPAETVEALKRARLLGASVPTELGGFGCSIGTLAAICETLGQYCSSTAMIFAMHHIQVASIVYHQAASPYFTEYLKDLAKHQYLIASVTSEVGVGGDMRSSGTAVEVLENRFSLNKEATTISYGAQADALLVTSRRSQTAPPNDQVLTLVQKADYTLEQTSDWDTLGMRGTSSPGFRLRSQGNVDQILPTPFSEIATQTMVPYSHILWCSVWSGMAKGAVARARSFVRAAARKKPGTVPPAALRLAEVVSKLQTMQQNVSAACFQYESLLASPSGKETISTIGFALQMNNLKIAISEMVVQIVMGAMGICGIAGYKNDTPYSLGRYLRDAHSAALMIANDRMLATNATLLLIHKDI